MTEEPIEASGKVNDEGVAADYLDDLGLSWEMLRGKRVLDLGAGGASFARIAKKNGIEVISLDIRSKDYQAESLEFGKTAFVQSDVQNLPFNDETFDLVVARAVVHSPWVTETINDLKKVLSEVRRILRKGGEFRFGPGTIEAKEMSGVQRQRLSDLVIKGDLSDEEKRERKELERLVQKDILNEFNSGTGMSHLAGLSREEKAERLKKWSLKLLHSADPNITVHPGASWRGPEYGLYFIMRKK